MLPQIKKHFASRTKQYLLTKNWLFCWGNLGLVHDKALAEKEKALAPHQCKWDKKINAVFILT